MKEIVYVFSHFDFTQNKNIELRISFEKDDNTNDIFVEFMNKETVQGFEPVCFRKRIKNLSFETYIEESNIILRELLSSLNFRFVINEVYAEKEEIHVHDYIGQCKGVFLNRNEALNLYNSLINQGEACFIEYFMPGQLIQCKSIYETRFLNQNELDNMINEIINSLKRIENYFILKKKEEESLPLEVVIDNNCL